MVYLSKINGGDFHSQRKNGHPRLPSRRVAMTLLWQEGEVYELSEDISEELKLMGMEARGKVCATSASGDFGGW